jgi:transcriptional regulator with XRE-family HTH domain
MPDKADIDLTPAVVVAENLRRLKHERGRSLSEIARRAEIHRTHVSLILRGKRMIQIDTVVKLAGAVDVEPGELLRGIAWVPSPSAERPLHPGEPYSPGWYRAREPMPRPENSSRQE